MLFTIGHSTYSKEDFTTLLRSADIDILVDVRSHPGSRWPQFRREELEAWLPDIEVVYEWLPELGGWTDKHINFSERMLMFGVDINAYVGKKFPKQRIAQKTLPGKDDFKQNFLPRIKPYWNNRGLWDYSFFMSIPEFSDGIQKLLKISNNRNIAFMCCECQWWRCHRSMISDYLLYKGIESYHIMPYIRQKNKIKYVYGNKLTKHSEIIGNRLERYERYILDSWK